MVPVSVLVRVTVLVIFGILLVSGPLVPGVDLTSEPAVRGAETPGTRAEISVVNPPLDEFRIAYGRFGAGPYLYAPPVTVKVDSVRGSPTLIYQVTIRDFGFLVAQLVYLSDANEGHELTFDIDRHPVDVTKLDQNEYVADVSLRTRTGNQSQTVYEETVRVQVQMREG